MPPERRALLQIHVCVLLWGFTAILGKLISLPAAHLVWWRMLIVVTALALMTRVWRGVRAIPARDIAIYIGIGLLVALHWLTFYASIKLANASIAATCMAIAPVVMALIEPRLTGSRFEAANLALALLAVPGVVLVIGGIPNTMQFGFWVGLLSAALAAAFNALNKRHLGTRDAAAVTAIELAAGFALIAIAAPVFTASAFMLPGLRDFLLLLTLAIACTLMPFVLSLMAMRHLSAFTAQLAVCLEPVYAVAIAALFLGEAADLDWRFYLGGVIVLAAVFAHAAITARRVPPPPLAV